MFLAGGCGAQTPAAGSAVDLYRQLLQPVFHATDVHRVRGVQIDREDLHIVLTDGVIGLIEPVAGHVTGAFFEGEGQILLIPPDRAERTSLALFTGSGVLDEQFTTAYLRFVDDKLLQILKAGFRPEENTEQYIAKWQTVARSLAPMDSLQLLQAATNSAESSAQFLHLRLAGAVHGIFDVFFNTSVSEQISVAQPAKANNTDFYNIWTSFPMRSVREGGKTGSPVSSLSREGAAIRASDFRIHSRLSPMTNLEGEAEITFTARQAGQRTLLLHLSRQLKVSEARMNGQPVEFVQNEAVSGSDLAQHGDDMVAVVLPAPLEKDRPLKLLLKYAGPVMFDAGGGLIHVGSRGTWYPSLTPSFANFDLTFEYPSGWTLAATGRQVSHSEQNGMQTSRFVSDKPIPHAGFNLGRFETATATSANVAIDVYAAKIVEKSLAEADAKAQIRPDPAKEAENVGQQAGAVVQYLSRELGPFPYSHLEISQLPGLLSQSWPGLIYLSSVVFLNDAERNAAGLHGPFTDLLATRLMLAHEIGHQWWGDAVESESYRDEWMIESLANYCAAAMLEHENPDAMRVVLDHYRNELLKPTQNGIVADAGPVTLGERLTSSRFPGAYEVVLYGRGTWVLHMLRSMLRLGSGRDDDSLFFSALKDLMAKSTGGKISTRDLQRAMEQVLPQSLFYEGEKSLDWFFDSWINGAAVPQFFLEGVHLAQSGGKLKAKGTIRQEFAAKDMVTAIPLYSVDEAGHSRFLAFVFVDEAKTDFELTVPVGTRELLLDPENTVLRRQ